MRPGVVKRSFTLLPYSPLTILSVAEDQMPTRFAQLRRFRPHWLALTWLALTGLAPKWLKPARHLTKLVPVLGLAGCLYLLNAHLAELELSDLGQALGQLTGWQWLCATALTGISFVAVGQYDAVIHRVLGTGVAPGRARMAGVRAIALSQTVGFSSLSGGLVRLRCLPELDLWTVSRLSLLVSLSFLAAWAVLAGLVMLWGHGGPTVLIIVCLGLIVWLVARFRPTAALPGLTPWVGLSLLGWTALDTCAAALVLGVLLPPGLMPGFHMLFAAFLLSLGAGLLSQSPAGLGAFELSLLLLLPQIDQTPLLAAVLAYRVIYFLMPALIALGFLIKPAAIPAPCALQTATEAVRLRALARAPQADWTLAYQGAEIVLNRDKATGWMLRSTRRCLVALGRPLGQADESELRQLAARRGLSPVLYKADARTAARARAAGWRTVKIAQDAVIGLQGWTLQQPACRQLRRKLRGLDTAGVRIVAQPPVLPVAEMAQVAQDWAARNGGEKGFSMGQFDPALLARQQVILAYRGDMLIGFASFHSNRNGWSLDLMRSHNDAPCGTMHGLIHAAIVRAKATGMAQISLAAVPAWPGILAQLCARSPGLTGLAQFKGSFGPAWTPLYLCSPSRSGLIRGAIAVTFAIHSGPIRHRLGWRQGQYTPPPHHDHEHFRFETAPQACHAQGMISRAAAIAHPADRPQLTGPPDDQRPFPPA